MAPAKNARGHSLGAIRYHLSLRYLVGYGTRKDLKKAFKWNRRAAEVGFTKAVRAMGWFYYNGFGVKKDLTQARKWYERATGRAQAAGRRSPSLAMALNKTARDREFGAIGYMLSNRYLVGFGMRKDLKQAFMW